MFQAGTSFMLCLDFSICPIHVLKLGALAVTSSSPLIYTRSVVDLPPLIYKPGFLHLCTDWFVLAKRLACSACPATAYLALLSDRTAWLHLALAGPYGV